MEAHGGPGMLEFFRYVADRTDIALGMFNSPSSGYEMTPAEVARVAEEIPAMCAIKDPATIAGHGIAVSKMVPGKLVMWDVSGDLTAPYLAGYVQEGLQGPCILGGMAYLTETPSDKRYTNGSTSSSRASSTRPGASTSAPTSTDPARTASPTLGCRSARAT